MRSVSRWAGDSARQGLGTEFPSSEFYCGLDRQPDHLVPEWALDACGPENALFLNPGLQLTSDKELPSALSGKEALVDNFARRGQIAWIPAADGALQPFWLNREWIGVIETLRTGGRRPSDLPPVIRQMLAMAGILVKAGYAEEQREKLDAAGKRFRQHGYAPVAGLIHPLHVAALRRYYRHRIRTGGMVLGDDQSARRYVAHNESVARFFHHQLTASVTAVAGEPVKPSYVYSASYRGGAKLDRHTDREQCEFSITFCLDYSPEPKLATGWPLHLHPASGMVTVYQAIGDGLLYRGCQLPHSRGTLRQGHTSTSIFFHYVRESFSGPLD